MLVQHGPVPEISITFDPETRCYGFSTRLPGMHPHWVINTFESLEAAVIGGVYSSTQIEKSDCHTPGNETGQVPAK